jgi:hypothetical protein
LNGVNPTIDIAFGLDLTGFLATNQLNRSFSGDVNDTALVSFTPLDGVTVDSASGVFPGTVAATPVPSSPPTLRLRPRRLRSARLAQEAKRDRDAAA